MRNSSSTIFYGYQILLIGLLLIHMCIVFTIYEQFTFVLNFLKCLSKELILRTAHYNNFLIFYLHLPLNMIIDLGIKNLILHFHSLKIKNILLPFRVIFPN